MPSLTFDPILYRQIQIACLYCKRHGLGIREFLDMDNDIDVLGYVGYMLNYGGLGRVSFRLNDEVAVLDRIDRYVIVRKEKDLA